MNTIFDGRLFASSKEKGLSLRVLDLFTEYDVTPRLVSIIVGEDPASIMYLNLKKKAAEKIGAQVGIISLPGNSTKASIIKNIEGYNKDSKVNGIMIQLPLPKSFSPEDRDEIISSISEDKDVDGLRTDSKYIPPTAKAVLQILTEAFKNSPLKDVDCKVAIVGASGFIGRQIVRTLEEGKQELGIKNLVISKLNSKTNDLSLETKNSDVIISVTGRTNLITQNMVKSGAILIDVGAPQGDMEKNTYTKASFVSPVPGGVGPVTISCLMENLVTATELQNS